MKKSIIVILVLLLSLFLMSCEETITEKATITLDVNGGNTLENESFKFTLGQKISLDDLVIPTKAKDTDKHIKYTFSGWALEDETIVVDSEKEYTITKDETLKAKWDEVEYFTVSFDLNGSDQTINQIEVNKDETITLPSNPSSYSTVDKTYSFDKWIVVEDEQDHTTDYQVTKNITLKADWTETDRLYTIIYEFRWWCL